MMRLLNIDKVIELLLQGNRLVDIVNNTGLSYISVCEIAKKHNISRADDDQIIDMPQYPEEDLRDRPWRRPIYCKYGGQIKLNDEVISIGKKYENQFVFIRDSIDHTDFEIFLDGKIRLLSDVRNEIVRIDYLTIAELTYLDYSIDDILQKTKAPKVRVEVIMNAVKMLELGKSNSEIESNTNLTGRFIDLIKA